MKDTSKHPCFNKAAKSSCGRVHLPVAPKCNVQCNYCNRKYDCVNESRPGVSSGVLKPFQAGEYMDKVLAKEPRISVAGIAGPGDPFANPTETLETMRILNEKHPHLLFCLSSNGMGILPYLDDIKELGVSHVTITISAVDPAIGAKIYSWVKDGNILYRGEQGAKILLEKQILAIKGLKERGIIVKINTIAIPGINEDHIEEVARVVSELGADIQNIIPLKPTEDTPFELFEELNAQEINTIRKKTSPLIKQMTHCKRCRADAVGLLCNDQSKAMAPILQSCSTLRPVEKKERRPYVAIASREGMLINQHIGEAKFFYIWSPKKEGGYRLMDKRHAPRSGCGPKRWELLCSTLKDCRAVLAANVGETPRKALEESGLDVHCASGFVEDALNAIYTTGNIEQYAARRDGVAAACCTGTGGKCI